MDVKKEIENQRELTRVCGPDAVDKPAVAVPDGWNIVTSENWNIPRVGQRVILFSNGVVQEESYTLDQADGEPGCGYYFWNRDDLDECPKVKAGDMWINWPDAASPSHSQQSVVKIISQLVGHIERQTCLHEETHRGGVIWEICDSCGAKWADDMGGKPEFRWPSCVEEARQLLSRFERPANDSEQED